MSVFAPVALTGGVKGTGTQGGLGEGRRAPHVLTQGPSQQNGGPALPPTGSSPELWQGSKNSALVLSLAGLSEGKIVQVKE